MKCFLSENRTTMLVKTKTKAKEAKLSDFYAGMLEWQICRAAQIPGPGAYDEQTRGFKLPNGGHFSKFSSKGYCDDDIKRGLSTPGPADYPTHVLPKAPGGRFNQSKSKSELDWIALRWRFLSNHPSTVSNS